VTALAGIWLGARELRVRWPRILLAAAVITVLGSAAVTMELLARAREEAIAARIDFMGPPITVVPAGVTSEALGRYDLGSALLPSGTPGTIAAVLGSALRRAEPRLVLGTMVNGRRVPLVGLGGQGQLGGAPAASGVLAGAEIARSLPEGVSIPLGQEMTILAGTLPPTGSIDDAALFVPLPVAQRLIGAGAINEVRVYLRAGVEAQVVAERLEAALPGTAIIRHDRGSVAGSEAQASLAAHRQAVYAVLGAVALLCLLIAAHLDAAERRLELATFVAIGAPPGAILSALLLRSVVTATVGAGIGAAVGVAVAAGQDAAASGAWHRWLGVAGAAVACAVAMAVLASVAVGVPALRRDPVRDLQEA
jgi:hypothetical protein